MSEKLTAFYRLVVVNEEPKNEGYRGLWTLSCLPSASSDVQVQDYVLLHTQTRINYVFPHPPEILLIGVINGAAPELLQLWYRMPCT